jgi:hypothetical protein
LISRLIRRLRLNKDLEKRGYDIEHNRYPEGYQEAPLAYDAVWSVALAFNKTMERLKVKSRSLKDFTYTDKDIADEIYAAMNSTQFLGVSVSERDCLLGIKITINSDSPALGEAAVEMSLLFISGHNNRNEMFSSLEKCWLSN